MSTYRLTVEINASDKDTARQIAEQAGFTVKRVTVPTTRTGVTSPVPGLRANAALDRPASLSSLEAKAYVRGYARACMSHVRKNGIPRATDTQSLREATITAEWDRHPAAHRKGMTFLVAERDLAASFAASRSTEDDAWTEGTAA